MGFIDAAILLLPNLFLLNYHRIYLKDSCSPTPSDYTCFFFPLA